MSAPISLRPASMELEYQYAQANGTIKRLEEMPRVRQWDYWYLVKNSFPYSIAFQEHDMLIPLSGAANRQDLTMAELIELDHLIEKMSGAYDLMFENFKHRRSILSLFHLHLAKYHETREDMRL